MFTLEDTTTHKQTIRFTLLELAGMNLPGVYAVAKKMRPGTTRVFTDNAGRKLRLRRY